MILKSLRILKKTKKKFEIVIVDDGCPENSGKIAQDLSKKNPKIRVYFHKKNLGYGAAVKTGLKNSWTFESENKLTLEDSIYIYDGKRISKTKQIVISGLLSSSKNIENWSISKLN